MAAVRFQFAATPSFSHLSFRDDADVSEAVSLILQERKRQDPKQAIAQQIKQQTGWSTVGQLRSLSDAEWRSLDIPAMCRILLKYLMRQAGRISNGTSHQRTCSVDVNMTEGSSSSSSSLVSPLSTTNKHNEQQQQQENMNGSSSSSSSEGAVKALNFMEQLQNDFNFGQPLDISPYLSSISVLTGMGFEREKALEALMMIDNKSVDLAIELLLRGYDEATWASKRKAAADKLGRRALPAPAPSPSSLPALSSSAIANAVKAATQPLHEQIASLTAMMAQQKEEADREIALFRANAEKEMKMFQATMVSVKYKEYLAGLTADGSLSHTQVTHSQNYKTRHGISPQMHAEALAELGLTQQKFDNMLKPDNECVVCLERPRTHIILNCMHLCLCEVCSNQHSKCPLCDSKVVRTAKVFLG